MPNQSLSGKWRFENLIVDTMNKERKRNTMGEGHPYTPFCSCGTCHLAFLVATALKSCLVDEIRSFPYTDSKYLDCNCQGLEEHNKMILDDILRKLEEKDE